MNIVFNALLEWSRSSLCHSSKLSILAVLIRWKSKQKDQDARFQSTIGVVVLRLLLVGCTRAIATQMAIVLESSFVVIISAETILIVLIRVLMFAFHLTDGNFHRAISMKMTRVTKHRMNIPTIHFPIRKVGS
jgi:hypothetical protein